MGAREDLPHHRLVFGVVGDQSGRERGTRESNGRIRAGR